MNLFSTNHCYERLLSKILLNGDLVRPRKFESKEILCNTEIIPMRNPVVTIHQRKLNYRFMAAEAIWILSGSNRVEEVARYVSRMREFSDDGVRLQGAYGPRFIEQVRYVIDSLRKDHDTRQAVMTFWRENPRDSRDIPCTISLQFLIRDHRLHCIATMRSSDAWLGWPYDVFSFSMIATYILLSFQGVVLNLGNLYLTAGSQHLYGRDAQKAHQIVAGNTCLQIGDIQTHMFNTPDHLLTHLECVRDCTWSAMTVPFMSELANLNHDHHQTNTTGREETRDDAVP